MMSKTKCGIARISALRILSLCLVGFFLPQLSVVYASSNAAHLLKADINPEDKASLARGAKNFVDYCFGCHSLSFMRYNRIARDLDLSEDHVSEQLLFTGAKVGDTMDNAMRKDDASRWFGTKPPDLSVIVRSRSVDWIYTYLHSFYADDSRPWGVNNALFKDVAMPHVLWELQGLQKRLDNPEHSSGPAKFELIKQGRMTPEQYSAWVKDTVNFLNYASEPTKLKRLALGKWVLAFLVVFSIVMYLLKLEIWKDIKNKK